MFFFFLSHLVKKTTHGTKYLVLGITAGPGSYGGHQTPAFWERNEKNIYKVIYIYYTKY